MRCRSVLGAIQYPTNHVLVQSEQDTVKLDTPAFSMVFQVGLSLAYL